MITWSTCKFSMASWALVVNQVTLASIWHLIACWSSTQNMCTQTKGKILNFIREAKALAQEPKSSRQPLYNHYRVLVEWAWRTLNLKPSNKIAHFEFSLRKKLAQIQPAGRSRGIMPSDICWVLTSNKLEEIPLIFLELHHWCMETYNAWPCERGTK